jgi:hypothetical protein
VPCDEHDPNVVSQIMLVRAYNFPQPTPNTIADNCTAKAPADDKTGTRRARTFHCESAKSNQLAALGSAFAFYAFKIRIARQPARLWERKRTYFWHTSVDLTARDALTLFCMAKVCPRNRSQEDSLQANDAPRLRSG